MKYLRLIRGLGKHRSEMFTEIFTLKVFPFLEFPSHNILIVAKTKENPGKKVLMVSVAIVNEQRDKLRSA
jgi:hypothetical protein